MSNMARIFFAFTNSRCCMLLPFFAKWCATMSMARINPVDDAPFVRFVSNPQFVAPRADYFERFAQPKTGLHYISAVYRY